MRSRKKTSQHDVYFEVLRTRLTFARELMGKNATACQEYITTATAISMSGSRGYMKRTCFRDQENAKTSSLASLMPLLALVVALMMNACSLVSVILAAAV